MPFEKKDRILAIDYGSRRLGFAVCDEFHLTTRPLSAIDTQQVEQLFLRIKSIVIENEIDLIIVGLPLNIDGTKGEAALNVELFAEKLRAFISCPVEFEDERLSTHEAKEMLYETKRWKAAKKNKSIIDSMAAVVILKTYLSRIQ